MQADTKTHRLSNGIRLATVEMPYMESAAIGIWTEAGSRHERSEQHGMAHFVEHLLFKGTPSRTAMDISRQVERMGASIDAFTVEDHTCYHAHGPAGTCLSLLEVMGDLYQNPVFDPGEIEAEKSVISEEISMIQDHPAQLLEDLISEGLWGSSHPLGRTITGTRESVASFSRDQIFRFFKEAYCGAQTVISVAGNIRHDEIADAVSRWFGKMPRGDLMPVEPAPPIQSGQAFEEVDDREQVHLALAFRAADRADPERFSQKILSVILGENMSSRLFQELREKLGLCYEVQCETFSFSDAGALQIYMALDPARQMQALEVVRRIVEDLCLSPPEQSEVDDAIQYCVGQNQIHLEKVTSQMMWAGESLLSFDEWIGPEVIRRKIAGVTPGDVQASARNIFTPDRMSIAICGPESTIDQARRWAAGLTIRH